MLLLLLPRAAISQILELLPPADRQRLAATCKVLHQAVRNDAVCALSLTQQDLELWADEALSAFPRAVELTLSDVALGSDCALALLSTAPDLFTRLKSLQVINPTCLEVQALMQLVSSCPLLTELHVRGSSWDFDSSSDSFADSRSGMHGAAQGGRRLLRLCLQHNSNLSPSHLVSLLSVSECATQSSSDSDALPAAAGGSAINMPRWCRALINSSSSSNAPQFNDSGTPLHVLAPAWPHLTAVNLSACPKIGGSLAFMALCPSLLSLTLHSCFKVTDATLQELSTALNGIGSSIQQSSDSVGEGSCILQSNDTHAASAGGSNGSQDGCTDAANSHKVLPPLQVMDLSYTRVKDAGMPHLVATLPSLQSLALKGCNVGDDGLVHLLQLTNLTALHIKHCHRITDEGIQDLSCLSQLHSFSYGYTSMAQADDVAAAIGRQFTALTGLDLLASELTDRGLTALGALQHLRLLKLYQAGVTPEGLMTLASQAAGTGLQSLVLYGNGALTGLSCLGEFPCLQELQLGRQCDLATPMNKALLDLTALQPLTALTLERMDDLTVAALQHVMRGCKQLQLLRVRGCDGVCEEDMEELAGSAANRCHSSATACWAASPSCDTDDEEDGWQTLQP